ncbi:MULTISPECIES: S24 family peptidase [Snodgrassella]|uniref:S24 family peptidase n=1 Tax=Snodgrassella TaxID=1193515 RepID=UPI0008156939|nr:MULTISPECIES: helix-turn-helix transcriptional regulator [Snodgrassella]SCC08753.1 Peptidase S24-like [Snodgrassella sp. R-53583]
MNNRTLKLRYLIERDFGGSQVEFAKAIKRKAAQVNALVKGGEAKGGKNLGDALALYIERTLGLVIGWFDEPIEGDNSLSKSNETVNKALGRELGSSRVGFVEAFDESSDLFDWEVEVPFYTDICLSAGNGFSADIQDYNNLRLRFSADMLRRYNVNPNYAVCIAADGDSMEPVIPDGAIVGINTGDKTLRDDKLYAINHDGLLRIKTLRKLPSNKILIQSYNKALYPNEEVGMEDISIIGRIFWWSVFI